jgi:hypothetical protein
MGAAKRLGLHPDSRGSSRDGSAATVYILNLDQQ